MVKRNGEPVVTAATQVICLYKSHQRRDMMYHPCVRRTEKCITPWAFKIAATLSANINRDRNGPALITLVFIEWWGGGAPFCTYHRPNLLFFYLFSLPLSAPFSDRPTAGSDPWLFAYSAEGRSLYMCVCLGVNTYSVFFMHGCVSACVSGMPAERIYSQK